MTNEQLIPFLAGEVHEAWCERLIREIMIVDNVNWDQANEKLQFIEADNKSFCTSIPLGYVACAPYAAGIALSISAAIISTPMVFDLTTASWFNENYVTADVAEAKDLETWLEVGSWTWSWMEPLLGQVSFFLLCFQFARNQMLNMNWKPYTYFVKTQRAKALQRKYNKYDQMVLEQFSVTDTWSSFAWSSLIGRR